MSEHADRLDRMLDLLRDRCPVVFKAHRKPDSVLCVRGQRHASAQEVDDGTIRVVYEYALHEKATEDCTVEQAATLIAKVLNRDHLCRFPKE